MQNKDVFDRGHFAQSLWPERENRIAHVTETHETVECSTEYCNLSTFCSRSMQVVHFLELSQGDRPLALALSVAAERPAHLGGGGMG